MEDWPQHSKKRFSPGRSLVFEYRVVAVGGGWGWFGVERVGGGLWLKGFKLFSQRLKVKESNFEFGMILE